MLLRFSSHFILLYSTTNDYVILTGSMRTLNKYYFLLFFSLVHHLWNIIDYILLENNRIERDFCFSGVGGVGLEVLRATPPLVVPTAPVYWPKEAT